VTARQRQEVGNASVTMHMNCSDQVIRVEKGDGGRGQPEAWEDAIRCPSLQTDVLTAGPKAVSVRVGTLEGELSSESSNKLIVGCDFGYFGGVGETCLQCPVTRQGEMVGAFCEGYDSETDAHTYPVSRRGWYDLKTESELAICPVVGAARADELARGVCVLCLAYLPRLVSAITRVPRGTNPRRLRSGALHARKDSTRRRASAPSAPTTHGSLSSHSSSRQRAPVGWACG